MTDRKKLIGRYDDFESHMMSEGWNKERILIDNTSEFVKSAILETTIPMICSNGYNSILSIICPENRVITIRGIQQCEDVSDAYLFLIDIERSNHAEIPYNTLVGIKKLSDKDITPILICEYGLLGYSDICRFERGVYLYEHERLEFYISIPYRHESIISKLFKYFMKIFSIGGEHLDIGNVIINIEADLWYKDNK